MVTHISVIKVREDWIPEKLKLTATKTIVIANTVYLERNSWYNEYILFYSWEDDDRCLWQIWCLYTSFIFLSITSFGTWSNHVPKKKQEQDKSSEKGRIHFHLFSVSNTLLTLCWHVRERRVTVLFYGKIDKLLREVQDAIEYAKAYTNCDQEIVWI